MDDRPIVCAITMTIMDGIVVRWYADAEGEREIASAARNAVLIHDDNVPAAVRDNARAVHGLLSGNRNADVRHYATHERQGLTGPLIPKER